MHALKGLMQPGRGKSAEVELRCAAAYGGQIHSLAPNDSVGREPAVDSAVIGILLCGSRPRVRDKKRCFVTEETNAVMR